MSKLTPMEEALSTRLALMGLDLLCQATELIKAEELDNATRATFTPARLGKTLELIIKMDYKHCTDEDQVALYAGAFESFTDYEEQLEEWLEHWGGLAGWWFDEKTAGGEGTVLTSYALGQEPTLEGVYGMDIRLYAGETLEYRSYAPDTFTVCHNDGHTTGRAHVWARNLAGVVEQVLQLEAGAL